MRAHIAHIGIENFRIFKETIDFELAPITILTGTNSSGKSSLIRAFYFLNYCSNGGKLKDIIDIEDTMNLLGDFSKLPNRETRNDTITFYIPIVLRGIIDKMKLSISYKLISGTLNQGELIKISILSKSNDWGEIFQISKKGPNEALYPNLSSEYKIKIDLAFFYNEYIRESKQIKKYYKELSNSPLISKTPEKEAIFKSIHEQYFNFRKQGLKHVRNEYIPFFDKSGFFTDGLHGLDEHYEYFEKEPSFYNFRNKVLKLIKFGNKPEDKNEKDRFNQRLQESLQNFEGIIGFSKRHKGQNSPNFILGVLNICISQIIQDRGHLSNYFFSSGPTFLRNLDSYYIQRDEFFFECFLADNIRYSISEALSQFENSDFVSNFRNQPQRIYSSKDGGEFQTLIKRLIFEKEKSKNNRILKFINKYLTRLEIGHDIELERGPEGQGVYVYIHSKGNKILLADMGYGISQVLPLIFKIITVALETGDNKKLFVEEPESNLHPALQSKLAELFVDAAEHFGIQFIIETHSEYFIRKLQVLTANTYANARKDNRLPSLKTKDTNIYYFNHPDKVPEGEKQIYKINIESDGALTKNFGKGFFDESSKLNIALYQFSKANKN